MFVTLLRRLGRSPIALLTQFAQSCCSRSRIDMPSQLKRSAGQHKCKRRHRPAAPTNSRAAACARTAAVNAVTCAALQATAGMCTNATRPPLHRKDGGGAPLACSSRSLRAARCAAALHPCLAPPLRRNDTRPSILVLLTRRSDAPAPREEPGGLHSQTHLRGAIFRACEMAESVQGPYAHIMTHKPNAYLHAASRERPSLLLPPLSRMCVSTAAEPVDAALLVMTLCTN